MRMRSAEPGSEPGDAVAEADHFIDTASPVPGELLPALDIERSGGLGPAALEQWVGDFTARVRERTGLATVIYTSPAYWTSALGGATGPAAASPLLWIAHWDVAAPSVPAANWAGHGWAVWQHSSTGSVPGIAGPVDMGRLAPSLLEALLVPAAPSASGSALLAR